MSEWWAGDVPPSMIEELEMSDWTKRRRAIADRLFEQVARPQPEACFHCGYRDAGEDDLCGPCRRHIEHFEKLPPVTVDR